MGCLYEPALQSDPFAELRKLLSKGLKMVCYRICLWSVSVVLLLLSDFVHCRKKPCQDECCQYIERFPAKLRELRGAFKNIRDYYEAKDDLIETALLDENLLDGLQSPFGCHLMNQMLHFYLKDVIPPAVNLGHNDSVDINHAVDMIGGILHDLKHTLKRCRRFFSCNKKGFSLQDLKNQFGNMQEKGVYKAMGELGLFFNYIEEYLTAKRHH
ncbi:interleukin-10-like [Acipenser oxyrinchus oxyrinchus]|uniref:Interleukin family protein n=1 Tax=Acipenser oxyrinchus oxyrinchus TaxID=40147 RepID=A0AAD8FQ95_ACIOX|nr:interleukin-10-like [Acipenser oxyrinchus oxyrinchus]KAK1144172.1 interleukin-10-like [Acipenser oxyrinchus oxyrinchus]